MKTVYIADDGKQFDNEYDCESYELEKKMKNIIILTSDEEIISSLERAELADIIIAPTKDGVENACDIMRYYGIYTRGLEQGINFYNESKGGWVSFDEIHTDTIGKLKAIEAIGEKCKQLAKNLLNIDITV